MDYTRYKKYYSEYEIELGSYDTENQTVKVILPDHLNLNRKRSDGYDKV